MSKVYVWYWDVKQEFVEFEGSRDECRQFVIENGLAIRLNASIDNSIDFHCEH